MRESYQPRHPRGSEDDIERPGDNDGHRDNTARRVRHTRPLQSRSDESAFIVVRHNTGKVYYKVNNQSQSVTTSSEPPILEDNIITQLQEFTGAVWDRSDHVLLMHPSLNVEYINLDRYLGAFQRLFPNAVIFHDKILIRQEYRDALEALKGRSEYLRGAYVTGQPGIGTFVCCT